MKKFKQHLIDLLDDRHVPFSDSENEVEMDGLAVEFLETEYRIRAYAYNDRRTTRDPIVIGKFSYNDVAKDALVGVAEMALECRRWRKMPGFNVPEVIFAFSERTFLKGRKYWETSDYMLMFAVYRVRGLNTNYESRCDLIRDAGLKKKFVGKKKPFLLKEEDFLKLSAEPFSVVAESACRPISCLPVDPNMVLAWFERRQQVVTTNKEQCEAVGITIPEARVQQDNFLVLVPRDQMPLPLDFPHEWDV